MSRTFRDQFHRVTKRLNREWLRKFNQGSRDDLGKVDEELRRLNRKSGGYKKNWFVRKLRQQSIDKKYEELDD